MIGKTAPWKRVTAVSSATSYYEWPNAGDADWSYTTSCHEQRYRPISERLVQGIPQQLLCSTFALCVVAPCTKSVRTTHRTLNASSTRTGLRSSLRFTASWHSITGTTQLCTTFSKIRNGENSSCCNRNVPGDISKVTGSLCWVKTYYM